MQRIPKWHFKACVHMYGAIDEQNNFQNSVCVLDLSLDPDIPVYTFHLLKQELKKQCNKKAVIEFPGRSNGRCRFYFITS
jgi:hypothetical protein